MSIEGGCGVRRNRSTDSMIRRFEVRAMIIFLWTCTVVELLDVITRRTKAPIRFDFDQHRLLLDRRQK